MSANNQVGEIVWMDLTVENASEVQHFYQQVVGWKVENVSMGDYNDFSMNTPEDNTAVTGVCHAKGPNVDMPAAWMPYFLVADVDASSKQ
jgi:predicted enzyme related to lactoylglutathione lyase